MSYQPLADLFAQLTSAAVAPDVLVLMGPFVSVNHPVVRTGHITEETDDGEVRSSIYLWLLNSLFIHSPLPLNVTD